MSNGANQMIMTTPPTSEGRTVKKHLESVAAESLDDPGIREYPIGPHGLLNRLEKEAKETGADAVVGINISGFGGSDEPGGSIKMQECT